MKSLIVGGAGFIGSHMAAKLLKKQGEHVVIYDNFTSGTDNHLKSIHSNTNLEIIRKDVKDLPELVKAANGIDVIYHFASNPDISKAITQPDIDFWEGTYLTNNVAEAARQAGVKKIIYASGSGIYGDAGDRIIDENFTPMRPISTYGASKLAGEALLCSYCEMFGLQASGFRFANVVGPKQTHGVGYDFIRKLRQNPGELAILGDGSQSKSYLYVDDVLNGLETVLASNLPGFSAFNVSTPDAITVTQIADMVCQKMKLENVRYNYGGGKRGWKGDVPVIRLSSDAIRKLGWVPKYNSFEAISASLDAMLAEG
jgi:UDP-glucose 4-epimerase